MQAYRIHEFGDLKALRREELPSPVASHGEVVLRVRAVSLNFRDLLMVKGLYNPKLKLPVVLTSDGAGEIIAVGEGVSQFKVGDRVIANFFEGWIDGDLTDAKGKTAHGGEKNGMLAQEVAVRADALVRIPDHLSYEEAATLPCAALTAWNALFENGQLKPGQSVLIQGTGGVSLFALQFARMAGARVIGTSSSDAKLARILEMGASDGINYKTTPNWEERVRELTDGTGVDQVIEVGGAGTFNKSCRAVRTAGTISLIGVLAGPGEMSPFPVLIRQLKVQGIFVGSRAMLNRMCKAISTHQLKPVVDRVFEFDQTIEALQYLESGAHFGKVVIRV